MNPILDEQRSRNARSRDSWERFGAHRRRVTDLLLASAALPSESLCVLGAGNCNDLELGDLAQSFSRIELVDLDADALRDGVARQHLDQHPELVLRGGVDVTGIGARLARWSNFAVPPLGGNSDRLTEGLRTQGGTTNDPSDDEVAQYVEAADSFAGIEAGAPFGVVASVCLLSQLIDAIVFSLGTTHRRFSELLRAVRARHLRLIVELLRPGGVGVLITDIVASDSVPNLAQIPGADLDRQLRHFALQGNVFIGISPQAIEQSFRGDRRLANHAAGWRWHDPWLWDFGPRIYAVHAASFRKT